MKRQKTKRGLDPNYEVEMINKVKEYIRMEYNDETYQKICSGKFLSILTGYVCNCLSMKSNRYTVPFMANHIVQFASKSN